MADLLDIAPKTDRVETVQVLGQDLAIRPLTISVIAKIAGRYPNMRKSIFRDDVPEDVKSAALLEAWPAIIAAGTGHLGDPRYEQAAERLPQDAQIALGGAIWALSQPRPEEAKEDGGPLPAAAEIIAAAQTEPTSSPPPSNT